MCFLCLVGAFFVSCASQMDQGNSDGVTLRVTATTLDENTDWSQSMEEKILEEDYSKESSVKQELTPMLYSVAENEEEDIYPRIDGAFSLDVSRFEKECYEAVDGFFRAFKMDEKPENFFKTANLYSLVMFLYDYKVKFGSKKISWHAIGEPFINDDYCQCPVRLFFAGKGNGKGKEKFEKRSYNGSHVDVIVFAAKDGKKWKLVSVEFASGGEGDS